MGTAEITEWIKWFLIIIVSIIMAWEKAKRWHFRRNGKDRRKPLNPHDIGKMNTKLTSLCQAFKDHEKHDDQRTEEIKTELRHFREEQGRHAISLGILKSRMNSR